MRKGFVTLLVALLVSSVAFAAEFSPTLMKLTADPIIQYDFDGSDIEIPVSVEGHTSGIIFSVYTKGKGEDIGIVHNGYLGWHWVNKIDTCIYYSSLMSAGIVMITEDDKYYLSRNALAQSPINDLLDPPG